MAGRRTKAAEFVAFLPRGGPEPRAIAHGGRAKRIDRDDGADRVARGEAGRGGAKTAFEPSRGGPITCAVAAQGEVGAGGRKSGAAQIVIGVALPGFVAAVQQVEQDRAGYDGHPLIANGKATTLGAQGVCHPGTGIEAKGRAARQDQRIDLLHQTVRGEQVRFPRARGPAHDVDRRNTGVIGQNDRDPRPQIGVMCQTDGQASHIGDQIFGAGTHGATVRRGHRFGKRRLGRRQKKKGAPAMARPQDC